MGWFQRTSASHRWIRGRAAGELHDRLVEQLQLAPLGGAAEVGLGLQPLGDALAHHPVEEHPGGAARGLGLVHRGVRVAHHLLGPAVAGVAEHHADAGGGDDLAAVEVVGLGERLEQALGHGDGVLGTLQPLERDQELVPAEAGGGPGRLLQVPVAGPGVGGGGDVLGPELALDALGDGPQQAVAGLVAQRVVDDLEAVEVQEEHRVVVAGFLPRPLQRLLHAVQQRRPVGQPGQPVGQGGGPQVVGHLAGQRIGPLRQADLAVLEHREQAREHDAHQAGQPDIADGAGGEAGGGRRLDAPLPARNRHRRLPGQRQLARGVRPAAVVERRPGGGAEQDVQLVVEFLGEAGEEVRPVQPHEHPAAAATRPLRDAGRRAAQVDRHQQEHAVLGVGEDAVAQAGGPVERRLQRRRADERGAPAGRSRRAVHPERIAVRRLVLRRDRARQEHREVDVVRVGGPADLAHLLGRGEGGAQVQRRDGLAEGVDHRVGEPQRRADRRQDRIGLAAGIGGQEPRRRFRCEHQPADALQAVPVVHDPPGDRAAELFLEVGEAFLVGRVVPAEHHHDRRGGQRQHRGDRQRDRGPVEGGAQARGAAGGPVRPEPGSAVRPRVGSAGLHERRPLLRPPRPASFRRRGWPPWRDERSGRPGGLNETRRAG